MTEEAQNKPKRGRAQSATQEQFEKLEAQYARLEEAFIKVCHYTGTNRILIDMGFEPYQVKAKDKSKYAKAQQQ